MPHLTPASTMPNCLQTMHSSDSAWMVTDDQLQVTYINDGFSRMFGYSLQDMQGVRPLQKLLRYTSPDLPPHIQEQLFHNGAFSGELLVFHQDGTPLWVSAAINTCNRQALSDAEPIAAEVMVFTDIGFTKRFEALQRQMLEEVVKEKPLPELMTHMCHGLESLLPDVRVSVLRLDSEGLLHLLASPSLPTNVTQLTDGLRIGPESGSCGTAAYLGHDVLCIDIATDHRWHGLQHVFVAAGIRACWSCPIKNHEGHVMGTFALYFNTPRSPHALHRQLVDAFLHLSAIAIERDISKQRIRQLAYYDTLTQLPNRTMFNECATQALHASNGQDALLFFLDLDRFKLWNDSLGHAGGDALLREVTHRLSRCTREGDVIGRISSDEFAILMPRCSPERMEMFAQRLLDTIAQPLSINEVITTPNACIGACSYPQDGSDIETLLRHADQAMYAAKKQGCQLWRRYRPEMALVSLERADMERALRQTLQQGGLQLHYQPQIRSNRTGLYGVEALARWHHPQWGWVAPPRFIAVAEDSGLIHSLTRWLIQTACQQLAAWRSDGLHIPHVAVNLSTKNFHDPKFAQQVQNTLAHYGLSSEDLMLEITESVMLDSSPATLENLHALHAMGMQLSMDDFGTGYSSLSYLHKLPITELKLDKSFVQDINSSAAAGALTRSVLNIATSLRMTVVAEGVETQEQAQWLQTNGCTVLQGYLYAKPMPAHELSHWVRTQALLAT